MIWIIDTETTGLPLQPKYGKYYDYKNINIYNKSRLVELAIIICDYKNNEIKENQSLRFIIRPDDFKIINSKFHGITNKMALKEGISFIEIGKFIRDNHNKIDMIIAHNINFDIHILCSELYRYKFHELANILYKKNKFCTSYNTSKLLKIKLSFGNKYKEPKLIELYYWLFGKEPKNLHSAMVDCKILLECVRKLLQKKLIKLF